jgi:hypothetical protein
MWNKKQDQTIKQETNTLVFIRINEAGGCVSLVEHLPSMLKTSGLVLRIANKQTTNKTQKTSLLFKSKP